MQVDTENVEEMVHVMPMNNVLREDVREQLFTSPEALTLEDFAKIQQALAR